MPSRLLIFKWTHYPKIDVRGASQRMILVRVRFFYVVDDEDIDGALLPFQL
jgi:hypothetical protein